MVKGWGSMLKPYVSFNWKKRNRNLPKFCGYCNAFFVKLIFYYHHTKCLFFTIILGKEKMAFITSQWRGRSNV